MKKEYYDEDRLPSFDYEPETELGKAIKRYNDRFEDGFPSIPLLYRPQKEAIEMIETCIKNNKDVYDMGYVKLDDDIIY